MRLRLLILLLFCWQCSGGKSVENISIESLLDKVAIPTKIINNFFQRSDKSLTTNSDRQRLESSTVHYQNSNGFVPLIAKVAKNNEPNNNTDIGANRRSYQVNSNQDDFELLKVSNGTPIIANYDSYYDQSKESTKSFHLNYGENYKKLYHNKDRGVGKKAQIDNYDSPNEDEQYPYDNLDNKKNDYHYEKSNNNYNQKLSLPKTNYASLSNQKTSFKLTSEGANNNKKLKPPIVIEPNEYKIDVRLDGQNTQAMVSTLSPLQKLESKEQQQINARFAEGTNRNYDSADSRDFSDEYGDDYNDEKEKSRRLQKIKRKPTQQFDSSRRLPKEHRGESNNYDNFYDDNVASRKPNVRSKSRTRTKSKPVRVVTEYNYNSDTDNISSEDHSSNNKNNKNNNQQRENNWNQVTPNVEVSYSNGFEVDQIEKPKLHIVPVNIVQAFDHATALDNSQGFDITNAMFTGFVDGTIMSTASPLISTTSNHINENTIISSTMKPEISSSTPVPDVIVGQNSFNNPVHAAVLLPNNKLQQNVLNQYVQSTMAPGTVFAVTPRSPGFSASPTITPQLQQMLNKMQVFPFNGQQQQQQQSLQSVQTNSEKKNLIYDDEEEQDSYQPSIRSTTERTDIYHKKKSNKGHNGQYLASASMSVDHGTQRTRSKKKNNHSNHNNNDEFNGHNSDNNYQQQNKLANNLNNAFNVQPTVVPAILHTGIGLLNNQNPLFISNPQQTSQLFKATNDALENSIKQLQLNILANRNQLNGYNNLDNVGGASSNSYNNLLVNSMQKAQLPNLGAKNVEIINPNLNTNAYAINQIPAALVTTPFPIFTTTGFLTTKGATGTSTTQETPGSVFNPINFVPNYDLVKSQSILNNNVATGIDGFSQQSLNFVPLLSTAGGGGGNFFKNSQLDFPNNKPKLSPDLEKYAEEMFKESLRTIYNSHKWNNDPRSPGINNISLVNEADINRLRNELLRIKNSLRDSKRTKDTEGHHTENKIRAVKPGQHSHNKRPDLSGEHSHKHKNHGPPNHHSYHHSHNHGNKQKPQINDYLTPPRPNSFVSKSPFHDKPPKKRPPHGPRSNFNHENSRPRPRQGIVLPKSKGLEAQESSLVEYRYPFQQSVSQDNYNQFGQSDFQPSPSLNYPSLTTLYPEMESLKSSGEFKYDMNHQRTHNLIGLLMKNKQLPPGMLSEPYSKKLNPSIQFEGNRRSQPLTNEGAIRSQTIPLSRSDNLDNTKKNHKE